MSQPPSFATFVFTDIEGSTRLWEQDAERMRPALTRHDALSDACIREHRGRLVKRTGDGVHAVFDDAADAVAAVLALQRGLAEDAAADDGRLCLSVRCGVHAGPSEARDGDYYGPVLNRAARVMGAAHGGQVLLTDAVATRVAGRLPDGATLQPLGRVRLRDLATPEHVHQLCHPALRADFPALRSLESTPNNLPQQLNSFVGREREMTESRQLLGSTRLLTLFGMGGLGKSRLSVQLGAELLDDYPDGVWLVELAPLTDARLVPQAVASVLRVKEAAGHDVADALLDWVRDRQLLLILDNCEHLCDAVADLTKRLLQAGAGVRVLASSRDVLGVPGETVYALPPLAVPGDATPAADDPAALMRHEAVRLFVERAAAATTAFALTALNAAAVTHICRQLDGIPLALELAAARVRVLPPQAMAERLADRFRLLVNPDRTVLPRQRTLRALIDWSHDLLDEQERTLFRRLSVFAGGWTLEAAETVCAGGSLADVEVLTVLAQLVDRSLVTRDPADDRYRMLETVRAFALEQRLAADEGPRLSLQHARHYVLLAETARSQLSGPDQAAWLGRLDRERENLLAAHAHCGDAMADAGADAGAEACALGLRLAYALRPYWLNRGLLDLGYRITVEALERPGAQEDAALRFRGLSDAGWLAYFRGAYVEARQLLGEALSLAQRQGNVQGAARVLQPLGMACAGAGDFDAAQGHLEEGVRLAREQDNPRELAAAMNALAQLLRTRGWPERAEPLLRQGLPIVRGLGDDEYIAGFLLNLAMVSDSRRDEQEVRSMLLEAAALARGLGSHPAMQSALEVCAGLASDLGQHAQAARFLGMAEALAARSGLKRDPADEAFLAPRMDRSRAALPAEHFAEAEAEGRALQPEASLSALEAWLRGDEARSR